MMQQITNNLATTGRKTKWFAGIDSLRFVLAFIVMLSHFDNVYALALKRSPHTLLRYAGYFLANAFDGTSAVIAFFVISGFVIHYPNKAGISSLSGFWLRRLLRILIPLTVAILVGSYFNHPEKAVVWSLFCELIYYGIYPLLRNIKLNWTAKFKAAFAVAAVLIITLCRHDIIAFIYQTNNGYQGYYWQLNWYLTWIIGLPCWLLGVLIAENIDKPQKVSFKQVIRLRCAVYCISCFCCIGKFHLHLSYILSMNIFALLIYRWIQAEINYYKNRPPVALFERAGKFSYSLYLCHPSVFTILSLFMLCTVYTYPLFILLTIAVSYLFYLTVEKPGHQLARAIYNRIRRRYKPAV